MARAAILGTGLIGASVGLALRAAGWETAGWDPDIESLARAEAIGSVAAAGSAGEAVARAELVVMAAPVSAIMETLGWLRTDALVTDVAGVKLPVVAAAAGLNRFVGGHPMAGRETSGPANASGSMFCGASWVLTEDGADPADLTEMERIVVSMEAVPVVMSATAHDVAVAAASQLPHIAAAALVRLVGNDAAALELAAGGFRDLTRVTLSDPGWWVEVLLSNRAQVSPAVRRLAIELGQMADLIEEGDAAEITARLASARRTRASMAAPVETVGVLLEDRPGEIARVGHSLAASGVDLRDLQLRHAIDGGAGYLTLSVRIGEVPRLRAALVADGFRLV